MNAYSMMTDVYSIGRTVTHHVSDGYMIHSHPFYELYYCVSGEASYLLEGVEYTLKPDTLLLIPPDEFHGVRVRSLHTYDRWTLHFDPAVLSPERRELLLRVLPRHRRSQDGKSGNTLLANYIENAHALGLRKAFENFDTLAALEEEMQKQLVPIFLEALLAKLLVCACKLPVPQQEALRPSAAVEQVAEYINEHFVEPLTLDVLSEKFFISKSHLNLSFRKRLGTTVIDYVIRKRVDYARQLLLSGYPAAQTAAIAGFHNYSSFYRAYVKQFGHSPNCDYIRNGTQREMNALLPDSIVLQPSRPQTKHKTGTLWDRLPATVLSDDE